MPVVTTTTTTTTTSGGQTTTTTTTDADSAEEGVPPAAPQSLAAAAAAPFPHAPEDLTLRFLGEVLELGDKKLVGFEYGGVGEPGFLADVWRVTAKTAGDDDDISVVCKMNTQIEERLAIGKMTMAYTKEYSVYAELLQDAPVDCGKCHFSGITDDEAGFLLVMEDLAERGTHLDQLVGINFEQE